ncbi:helix-turn-helix domain-containing protein [Coleofasciculus sp.]|uniref:helix-turn-helix domain-containing protein n=1 Tax=Coleofasciculus sp. TaxID=3100458 RepID=UPI003A3AFD32
MSRSVKIHPDNKPTVLSALERQGFLTQGDLAAHLGIALSTVSNFVNSKAVSISKFEEICETLELDKRAITQPVAPNAPYKQWWQFFQAVLVGT